MRPPAAILLLTACGITCALAAAWLGYRRGVRRAIMHELRRAEAPEFLPEDRRPVVPTAAGSTPSPGPGAAYPVAPVPAGGGGVIDASRPVRLSWPLDVGPDRGEEPGAPDDRSCLRARQGANELQNPGEGRAHYAFSVPTAGRYRTWCRVRWIDDGVGHIACNNSWFAGIDDLPAEVVGRESETVGWHWEAGPSAELRPGLHWIRIELREDGTRLDRIAVVPEGADMGAEQLDRLPVAAVPPAAGTRLPAFPTAALQPVEIWAVPTGALAVGEGHTNSIAVAATYLDSAGGSFRGLVEVLCPSAPGVAVSGAAELVCGAEARQHDCHLTVRFPDDAPRRVHILTVRVRGASTGEVVFSQQVRFVKPWVWAFLGPFRSPVRKGRRPGGVPSMPWDADPMPLARRQSPASLGWDGAGTKVGEEAVSWRITGDGSCCDWTGAVDLQRVYGATTGAVAYAVSWIDADVDLHHRSFSFQADDRGWVWLSGRRLAEVPLDLPREAQRFWTSGVLRKGANPVVVRVTQKRRYWGFRFDVVDWHWQGRRGDVITGLPESAWPP